MERLSTRRRFSLRRNDRHSWTSAFLTSRRTIQGHSAWGWSPESARLSKFYGLEYEQALEVFRPNWTRLSATELTPMPGARALLLRLKDEGVRMALVTSADPVHARERLEGHRHARRVRVRSGRGDGLAAQAFAGTLYEGRRAPKAFHRRTCLPSKTPARAWTSALAAGMRCVAVHVEVHERHELAPAHFKMQSLVDFPPFA